jgi:O-acetyl-ADP-ribose deacetylase (regulator of RNase III)
MVATRIHDRKEEPSAKPSDPPNLKTKSGDLLKATEQYIVHQCNCVTITAAGLAKAIGIKFPFANPYAHRRKDPAKSSRCLPEDEGKLGTIQIWRPEDGQGPSFIGLYAQYGPGKPTKKEGDSKKDREDSFKKCMDSLETVEGLESIALPWQIGCGMAGGNWSVYEGIIREWAEKHPDVSVAIYKLESPGRSSRGRKT